MTSDAKIDGSCPCGAVRNELSGNASMAVHCHCTDCRKPSGAGHASSWDHMDPKLKAFHEMPPVPG